MDPDQLVPMQNALGTSDRAMTLARLTVMGHERSTGLVLLAAAARPRRHAG